ncbi:MAG: GAF domain-containing protein [Flaviflexus sp.]|uniref:sensor histidine kinase n=1 Tax=Flaviflexus sp. TaxID=1969482 RepID=UPI00352F338D
MSDPVGYPIPERDQEDGGLFDSALALTSRLDITSALQEFVESARRLTGAQYAALGILGSRGETVAFHYTGMNAPDVDKLPHPPHGHGVFAEIPTDSPLIINDLSTHPAFEGWPSYHPRMKNFLGVPVRIQEQVFGRIYLADKDTDFNDDDASNISMLASAAAIAVQNARLYSESENRAAWIGVSQQITTALLEGTDEEEALELIAKKMREVSKSCTALIVLPSVGDAWVCEIADGLNADEMIGLEFPPDGRVQTVIREGSGVVVDSMTRTRTMRIPELRGYGPALYAPMILDGAGAGVIILLRSRNQPEFDLADLAMAESVSKQAALALELAAARHAQDVAAQIDERAAISRDLHDLAIQQLFATGMQITTIKDDLEDKGTDPEVLDLLNQAISSVDESVKEIRQIVHRLREPDANVVLVERLRREASVARNSLGFAPSFVISLDGETLPPDVDANTVTQIDNRVGADVADDIVAVTREGLSNAARHAKASSLAVTVSVDGGQATVRVADDGVGLSPAQSRRSGLSNLAARARRHHGTFSMVPGDGHGTVLTWSVPLI